MKNKPIIIIAGDPDSIFIEILSKTLKTKKFKSPIVLICNKSVFINQFNIKNSITKLNILNPKDLNAKILFPDQINLINVNLKNFTKQNKLKYLKESFEIGLNLIKKNFSYKLINGPINKEFFLNKRFPGLTEYIAHSFKVKKIGMLIFNKKLAVSPVTTHLPIKLVSKKITKSLIIEKIFLINEFYKKNFNFIPKIAVTGLNPHCESILKFNEDKSIVSKAIDYAKKRKINVEGPYSGDTIFLKLNRIKFDVIVGMYHDQVLSPIKTLYEFDAINITMGLPFLRISPDHGPNRKMFGKNKSNPLSLIRSLEFLDKK